MRLRRLIMAVNDGACCKGLAGSLFRRLNVMDFTMDVLM